MKKMSKLLVLVIWAILISLLFRLKLLTGDMDNLDQILNSCSDYKEILFIGVSSLRVVALIPTAIFMVLGGITFNPLKGFLLSLVSVIASETIIYVVSKVLVGSKIENFLVNKNPKLYELLLRNNSKVLAIGILCPIAPSDVACFLASSTGLNYRMFIKTVIVANMPMMILYSFLGGSFKSSTNSTIMIGIFIILIGGYTSYLWKREQKQQRLN